MKTKSKRVMRELLEGPMTFQEIKAITGFCKLGDILSGLERVGFVIRCGSSIRYDDDNTELIYPLYNLTQRGKRELTYFNLPKHSNTFRLMVQSEAERRQPCQL